ncbi:DUF5994 family protein [Kitasatospora sp. NPDC059803]|uniref:DUF5994 family protein n=1 Tax=Kitasatospora sp. NPDC059803 TaxID=3346953 RepID=UPI00364A65F5
MTTTLDRAMTPTAPEPAARLSRVPEGTQPGRLDGAWWPRSRDLLLELPSLAAALDGPWGRVTRVTVNPAQWPTVPHRAPVAGHTVHVGWFTIEQDEHLIVVCSYAPLRLNLLVVPPETDAVTAERLMSRAADPADSRTASELLAPEPGRGATGPEPGTDVLPSALVPATGEGEVGRRADVARSRAASWPAGA